MPIKRKPRVVTKEGEGNLYVIYENEQDEMKLHIGTLLTSVDKLDHVLYVDVIPLGHLVTRKLDWKNSHISSIGMEDVKGISSSVGAIELAYAEYFI